MFRPNLCRQWKRRLHSRKRLRRRPSLNSAIWKRKGSTNHGAGPGSYCGSGIWRVPNRLYLELTNRWPKHPDLVGELGNVYVLLGEKNSARTAFRRSQKLLEPMGPSLQLEAVTRWLERHR